MSKIIGAVEIGTSCAKALVEEVTEGKSLNIVGKSVRKNEGMRKGEIVDFRKVASSVHAALEEAEKMSGTTVDSVYLAQTGAHIKGSFLRGSANVASPDGRVSVDDLQTAANEAKRKQPASGYRTIFFDSISDSLGSAWIIHWISFPWSHWLGLLWGFSLSNL